jgi:hypothetical protein
VVVTFRTQLRAILFRVFMPPVLDAIIHTTLGGVVPELSTIQTSYERVNNCSLPLVLSIS